MKSKTRRFKLPGRTLLLAASAVLLLAGLMLYKLGSLMGGLSTTEVTAAAAPVGWHGIFHHPQYLPLELLRSIDFFIFKDHGQTLTRLPNAILGALSIVSFAWLIRLWHSPRTAWMATALFASSAWTLHASRLASFDVLYLWAVPTLLLSYSLLQRYRDSGFVRFGSLAAWLLLLYIPGMIWLLLPSAYIERRVIIKSWSKVSRRRWPLYIIFKIAALALLVVDLLRQGRLAAWLGAPAHFPPLMTLLKQEVSVPVHLFIRGPQYPQLWLGRTPLLDVFTLAACLIGLYFYATHWQAARSKLLFALLIIGALLVGLNGPVSFSLLVPLLYVAAATGLAYLVHEWLQTFPRNPLARGLGLGIILLAVALSCTYNLRSYFIAWPHNAVSRSVFQYRRLR
jgi:hypothetical protein